MVRPGATPAFGFQGIVNNPNAQPVTARVSIDPCSDLDSLAGTCAAVSGS